MKVELASDQGVLEEPNEKCLEEGVLALEVEEHQPGRHARALRDGAHGDAPQPVACGDGKGGAEDGLAALVFGALRAGQRRASRGH